MLSNVRATSSGSAISSPIGSNEATTLRLRKPSLPRSTKTCFCTTSIANGRHTRSRERHVRPGMGTGLSRCQKRTPWRTGDMLVTALRRRRDDADMNVQTFKDPTVRVDARARKSREYDGQRLHLDAGAIDAGAFYASIAAIVGQPPADFKWTHIGHISREQRLRWRAEECR